LEYETRAIVGRNWTEDENHQPDLSNKSNVRRSMIRAYLLGIFLIL
jgi:hypothetical protein